MRRMRMHRRLRMLQQDKTQSIEIRGCRLREGFVVLKGVCYFEETSLF
jgi:hypothetical protein